MNRIRPNIQGVIVGLLALFFISGCGYGLRGSVNNLPPDIKGVYIPIFENQTIEAGAETIFANALIYEFTRSRVLQVVPESQAQAYIKGKIRSAAIDPVIYATMTQALQRKVTITLEISCRRSDNQKILWQNLAMARYEIYNISDDPNLTQRNKEEAMRKIAKDLSERIHNGILENF